MHWILLLQFLGQTSKSKFSSKSKMELEFDTEDQVLFFLFVTVYQQNKNLKNKKKFVPTQRLVELLLLQDLLVMYMLRCCVE